LLLLLLLLPSSSSCCTFNTETYWYFESFGAVKYVGMSLQSLSRVTDLTYWYLSCNGF
jgi:hypothetical protein